MATRTPIYECGLQKIIDIWVKMEDDECWVIFTNGTRLAVETLSISGTRATMRLKGGQSIPVGCPLRRQREPAV